MNLLDLSNYKRMTPKDCWDEHGWGSELTLESPTVLYLAIDGHEIFVDTAGSNVDYGGAVCCEISDEHRSLDGQYFADTTQDAIRGAVVDSIGFQVMQDVDNCEDAVNVIAGNAYRLLFGKPFFELTDGTIEQLNVLLGFAREFVKANIRWVDYEWEEF